MSRQGHSCHLQFTGLWFCLLFVTDYIYSWCNCFLLLLPVFTVADNVAMNKSFYIFENSFLKFAWVEVLDPQKRTFTLQPKESLKILISIPICASKMCFETFVFQMTYWLSDLTLLSLSKLLKINFKMKHMHSLWLLLQNNLRKFGEVYWNRSASSCNWTITYVISKYALD